MTTRSEFYATYDDLRAGFIGWQRVSQSLTVVWANVFSSSAHGSAWLAVAAADRKSAVQMLKEFGLHGFKLNDPPYLRVAEFLVPLAIRYPGQFIVMPRDGLAALLAE